MKRTAVWLYCCAIGTSVLLHGQDFNRQGDRYANKQGIAEVQATWNGLANSGQSVVDTVANNNTVAGITGNDYVEGALGKGVQALGGGFLGELPIADGSAVLGSIAGGDYHTAADTAVSGGMGAIAGWGAGALATTLIEGGVIVVSGPAWLPVVIVGATAATAALATKSLYEWLLHPDPADSGRKPNAQPSTTRTPKSGHRTNSTRPPVNRTPNLVGRDHDGGNRSGGCSDGH